MDYDYKTPITFTNLYNFTSIFPDKDKLFELEILDDGAMLYEFNLRHPTCLTAKTLLENRESKDKNGISASQYLDTVMTNDRIYLMYDGCTSHSCHLWIANDIEEAKKDFLANGGKLG